MERSWRVRGLGDGDEKEGIGGWAFSYVGWYEQFDVNIWETGAMEGSWRARDSGNKNKKKGIGGWAFNYVG